MNNATPWNRFVVEGFVIIVSILLAFAIDAWWDERNRRIDEVSLLRSLESELQQTKSGLEAYVKSLDFDSDNMRRIVLALDTADPATVTLDELRDMSGNYGPTLDFSVPRAVLNSLLNSGDISLVESEALKISIAAYEQKIASFDEDKSRLTEIWLNYLAPYRYQYGNMGNLPENLDGAERLGISNLDFAFNVEAFVGNSYYQNLLLARAVRNRDVQYEANGLIEQIDLILAFLGNELP